MRTATEFVTDVSPSMRIALTIRTPEGRDAYISSVHEWLKSNVRGKTHYKIGIWYILLQEGRPNDRSYSYEVHFELSDDAALFRLFWSEYITNYRIDP